MSQDNITVKSLEQVKRMVKEGVVKFAENGQRIVPFLHGRHGLGKTESMLQMADEMDYEKTIINLANLSPEDLLGQLDGKGGYYKPNWLIESEKPVLYVLDELTRAPKYVLQSVFNFLTSGRIHNYSIKPTDLVIAATNPSEEYDTTAFEDEAFLSRFMHIKVQPTQQEFLKYLKTKSFKNSIVEQTLKKTVHIYQNQDFSIGFQVTPDNRKLEKVAMMFDIFTDEQMENVGVDMLECLIGFEASAAFLETWREEKKNVFDPKKILNLTAKQEFPFKYEDVDIINNFNIKLCAFVKDNKLSKKEQKGFERYFMFIPRDLQVELARNVVEINEDLLDNLDTEYVYELINAGKK